MNIVLATDDNYVQHCAATMASVMRFNNEVVFYLLTESLTDKHKKQLEQIVETGNAELKIMYVPSTIVQKFPMPKGMAEHISVATYYRLFITELLPDNIDKVIYLDCDIIVRGSIIDLWNKDVANYALAAVYQYNEWSDCSGTWERLNIPRQYGYFNAGVLIINMNYWRVHDVEASCLKFIENNYSSIRSHDQDVLNAVLYDKVLPLDYKWNLLPFFFDYYKDWTFPYPYLLKDIKYEIKNPSVVHFVNNPKPWQSGCNNPFKKEYFNNLQNTPWQSFKPKFNLKQWFINCIWHKLLVTTSGLRKLFLKRQLWMQ